MDWYLKMKKNIFTLENWKKVERKSVLLNQSRAEEPSFRKNMGACTGDYREFPNCRLYTSDPKGLILHDWGSRDHGVKLLHHTQFRNRLTHDHGAWAALAGSASPVLRLPQVPEPSSHFHHWFSSRLGKWRKRPASVQKSFLAECSHLRGKKKLVGKSSWLKRCKGWTLTVCWLLILTRHCLIKRH